MLAAQARTVQEAIGGKLSLGVGLSHKAVVEGMWGISFERPANYMREYLEILAPLLRGERVSTFGERVSASTMGRWDPRETRTPGLLVAAFAPEDARDGRGADRRHADVDDRREDHRDARHADDQRRREPPPVDRAPRVVCSLPISVTADVADTMTKRTRN